MAYPNNWTCPACGALVNNSNSCTVCNYKPPAESGELPAAKKKAVNLLKERVIAFLIDIVVLSVIVLVSVFIFLSTQASDKPLTTMISIVFPPSLLIGFAVHPVYFLVLELILKGGSYGKLIMKIKAVSVDESKQTFTQLLIRNMMRFVEGLTLYVLSIYYINKSEESQRLGDRLAGTKVIKV